MPLHPRLTWGCRVFESAEHLVFRQPLKCLLVDKEARAFVLETISALDGRSIDELCQQAGFPESLGRLQVLDRLHREGMLIDHEDRSSSAPPPPRTGSRLDGKKVLVSGDARLVEALSVELAMIGAEVRPGDVEEARGAPAIVCRLQPDLEFFERINNTCKERSIAWLPVFVIADELIAGPLIRPSISACFSCFLLRWLGISVSVQFEREFLKHLRRGAWKDEPELVAPEWIARAALSLIAASVSGVVPPSLMEITSLGAGTAAAHHVQRHPLCEVCAEKDVIARRAETEWRDDPLSLSDLHGRIAVLASERVGLATVEETLERFMPASEGLPYVQLSRFAFSKPAEVRGEQSNWTHGNGPSKLSACALAIIEALERYSGMMPPLGAIEAPYLEVREDAILPTDLPLYSETQYRLPDFPFQPFDPHRSVKWVWGYSLTENRSRLVPATAVYYGEDDDLLSENSSGMAAHSARSLALANALYEVVERDAFMIHWLNRLSPPRVRIDRSEDEVVRTLSRSIEKKGWEPRVVELTTDLGIPVFLALAVRQDRRAPALLVGGGASLDPGTACLRSLRELNSSVVAHPEDWSPKTQLERNDVVRAQHHPEFYSLPEMLPRVAFLWASSRWIDPPSPASKDNVGLGDSVERLRSCGLELIGVDLTPPDVAPFGLRVVRAVVPGLMPLGFGRTSLRLGGRRLYDLPVKMGYRSQPTREEELNPDPHCFP